MSSRAATLVALIAEIRRCFWLLKTVSDQMLEGLDATAAQRAILEHLTQCGACTVPQIAAHKSVSRQSIQEIVDELSRRQLVRSQPNPAHRRSPLIALTSHGSALFAAIGALEREPLRNLAAEFDTEALANATDCLAKLRALLSGRLTTGESHERATHRPRRSVP
jgi:DNA-binding MarR family transcriptional regulator